MIFKRELDQEWKDYVKNDMETTKKLMSYIEGGYKMDINGCNWRVVDVDISNYRESINVKLECYPSGKILNEGIGCFEFAKAVLAKLNAPDINQITEARADTKSTTTLKEILNRMYGKHAYEPITPIGLPKIKDVLFNDPATIIFWADGTKTVVKCEGENFDPEKGMAMAISKKVLGNKYGYYDEFEKWIGKHCRKIMGNKAWNEMKKGKK